ncbi:toll-like receptor 3 [Haliotis rufescens]|uniref:toll-like receptor 3 n=1 Tax=Haliotis rufescens TaxID=6454 RepID=UPI00201F45A5|nr:toll-like receptor 3 [Haliotis rufescens]
MFLVKSSVALMCVLGLLSVDGDVIWKLCSKGQCLCRPHPTHAVYMNCSGGNFTHIPTPPNKSLPLYLTLDQNILTNVTGDMFHNIPKSSLRSLLMFNNSISNVSADAFRGFTKLYKVVFSNNRMSVSSLTSAVASLKNCPLTSLTISSAKVRFFRPDFFLPLAHLSNLKLSLVNNCLEVYQSRVFAPMKGLVYLNLRGNRIRRMNITDNYTQNIPRLRLESNRFDDFPNLCPNDKSYFPELTQLDIRYNHIRYLNKSYFDCLDKLKILRLDGNLILWVQKDQFAGLKSLERLSLAEVGCTIGKVEPGAFSSATLKQIFFRNNHIEFSRSSKSPTLAMFDGCPSLELLNVNYNVFSYLREGDYDLLFRNLTNLKTLLMGGCGINVIPKAIPKHLKNLTLLGLYHNEISDLEPNFFSGMNDLGELLLGNNEITSVKRSTFPSNVFNGSGFVDLSKNPLSCGCESLWLIETFQRHPDQFRAEWHKEGYVCHSPKNLLGTQLRDVQISEQTCLLSWSVLMILLVGSSVLITLLVILSLLYNYRWNLMYLVFMIRHKEREVVDRRQFLYDVFVAYSYDDLAWVKQHLMPVLEGSDGLKLCIHNRDFEVGKFITENIVDSVENSRKVIIVLSNNFAKSGWCQFELNLIQRHVIECGQRLLVVVMLEDIDPCHVTKSLRAMLQTTTYLEWGEESHTRQAFFNRLRLLVKRPLQSTSTRKMSV